MNYDEFFNSKNKNCRINCMQIHMKRVEWINHQDIVSTASNLFDISFYFDESVYIDLGNFKIQFFY